MHRSRTFEPPSPTRAVSAARRWVSAVVLAAALGFVAGCPEESATSARCVEMCALEANCAQRDRKRNFAEGECVAACAALERDAEGRKHVDRHAACVQEALRGSGEVCERLLACP